jgi:hypothetical protein
MKINSPVQFRANSEHWRRCLICTSVRGLVFLPWINVTLAHIPRYYIWTDSNQLTGSIPRELGALTSSTSLYLRTCIGLSWSHECHACSHLFAFLFEQMKINSRGQFRGNSEHWRRCLNCTSVRALVCLLLAWTSRLLTFPYHSFPSDSNQLTGSIPSELGAMTSLTILYLRTCIGLSCWHECYACSHFLAILFEQMQINSTEQFRGNSEHWRRWLNCGSVRGLVCLVCMRVMLAHICFPFCSIRI